MTTILPREKKIISIPPLANGDSLTSLEFERRYNVMPQLKKPNLLKEKFIWPHH